MDLKQLEVFLAVAQQNSFSKAAKKMFLTQPTVSAHIRALEKELGTQLIVRAPKGVFLTEDGCVLIEYARDMLALRDSALTWFQSKKQNEKSTVRIAASTVPAQYLLPHAMAALCREDPGARFEILRCDSEGVVKNVVSRKVEFGLAGTRTEDARCRFEVLCEDRLVLITPDTEHYRQLKARGAPAQELAREPFLVREKGSGTQREAERFLKQLGVDAEKLHIVAQLNDPESMKQAVSQGMGIAVVSELGVRDYERFGMVQVLRFETKASARRLYLVKSSEHRLSDEAQTLCRLLRSAAGVKEKSQEGAL